MKRFTLYSRLKDRRESSENFVSTYELSAEYIKRVHRNEALNKPRAYLGPLQRSYRQINAVRIRRNGRVLAACWSRLSERYEGVIAQVYHAAGITVKPSKAKAVFARLAVDISTRVRQDAHARCFAEVLWSVLEPVPSLTPADADRLRHKLHLRALTDELPVDQRLPLVFRVFSARATGPLTHQEHDLVVAAIEALMRHMLSLGTSLGDLTENLITTQTLGQPAMAQRMIDHWLVKG
jgi:hypothetical protein